MNLLRRKGAALALAFLTFIILSALFVPMMMEGDYQTQYRGEENWPPLWQARGDTDDPLRHPLGTDTLGRDNLLRLMYGTRVSLLVAVCATAIVLVIGSIYGALSGYLGGRADAVMMRAVDVICSIPDVLVVLLLSVALRGVVAGQANLAGLLLAFALVYWTGMSRIVRGQVLSLKERDYVVAARALGAGPARVLLTHLLPGCAPQLIVAACLQIPSAIFMESFLSFLGLGVAAPLCSLGSLASEGLGGIYTYPYRLIVPCATLCLILLSLNVIGDALIPASGGKKHGAA